MKIWKEPYRPLLVPRELMDEVVGNRNHKISVIVTKSNEVIVTRRPKNYDFKYNIQIGRCDDFVPTAALKVAGIDQGSEYEVTERNGDLVVTDVGFKFDKTEHDIMKPRKLDL